MRWAWFKNAARIALLHLPTAFQTKMAFAVHTMAGTSTAKVAALLSPSTISLWKATHSRTAFEIDAYEVQELGGLVWAYMGPSPAPLLPRLDLLVMPGITRTIAITRLPCNWLQCMENSLDPVHFEWLHANLSNYLAERRGEASSHETASHLDIAFDVFDLGIQKRRLLQDQDPGDFGRLDHRSSCASTYTLRGRKQLPNPCSDR